MCVNRSGLVVPVAVAIETLAGDDLFPVILIYHTEFLNKKWRRNVLLPTSNSSYTGKIVTFTMVDLHYISNGKQIHITFAEHNACECKIQC